MKNKNWILVAVLPTAPAFALLAGIFFATYAGTNAGYKKEVKDAEIYAKPPEPGLLTTYDMTLTNGVTDSNTFTFLSGQEKMWVSFTFGRSDVDRVEFGRPYTGKDKDDNTPGRAEFYSDGQKDPWITISQVKGMTNYLEFRSTNTEVRCRFPLISQGRDTNGLWIYRPFIFESK